MIKALQYGEGNFLRSFADYYFDVLNGEGNNYEVNIVKPSPFGNLNKFKAQNNVYHVILRGTEKGEEIEKVREITCVKNAVDPLSITIST